ncbi:APC family permease [Mycoplasma bradburyae]|uniref:APC family permease n=1 Tax=Mycoplasma bradburyae TaxID=2963128 RepID=A0AAW6HML1_9MOLU|nr:APC family permease [Mycoplasma bradburyae]MDC4163032.1 APC family permease [Mycoplasma bradburyae]MDC4181643.1 APC family permease [Mycoplasma bradburyae]MDC4182370.1 APC family permease [Mycoplasma bradburyae]MDC4183097.1 APC family permease [Mycoplasma bradburyae]MDC4183815.1 APC family permease [Mycoplasma bradburyae]
MNNLNTNEQNNGLKNAPQSKKIGFFSGIGIAIGSSIGAGIFFKAQAVLQNSQFSLVFAIFCWLFAAFSVISMALALIEISSGRNDNLSIIGWCQTFTNRYVYKSCKNFMVYIYVPLTYFFMPLYFISSIQDGIKALNDSYNGLGTQNDWAIMMLASLGVSSYFIIVTGLSSRAGNVQNIIISLVKFLPLAFAIILGFVIFTKNNYLPINDKISAGFQKNDTTDLAAKYSFNNLSPGFGMFIAVGGIYFAYDGFYYAAGIQSEMKKPEKTPLALLIGLAFVTLVYLLMAVAMSLGSEDGSPFGFESFFKKNNLVPLYVAFQVTIGVGILGIINGLSLWANRFIEDLIKQGELPFSMKLINKISSKNALVGLKYNLVIAVPVIIIASLIGGLGYIDSGYSDSDYGTGVGKIYSFADLMGNWTSVIAFGYIVITLFGGLSNRKTNRVKVIKSKLFIPSSICAIVTMLVTVGLTFFQPFADLFLLYNIPLTDEYKSVYISRIMTVVVLFIYLAIMFIPVIIEDRKLIKKYGSIQKGEIAKLRIKAKVKNTTFKEELLDYIETSKIIKLNDELKEALMEVGENNFI